MRGSAAPSLRSGKEHESQHALAAPNPGDPEARWRSSGASSPSPAAACRYRATPPAVISPSQAGAVVPERRFCPECGAWFFADESTCPRDGVALKPVRESVP